jgi:hypothetical protein
MGTNVCRSSCSQSLLKRIVLSKMEIALQVTKENNPISLRFRELSLITVPLSVIPLSSLSHLQISLKAVAVRVVSWLSLLRAVDAYEKNRQNSSSKELTFQPILLSRYAHLLTKSLEERTGDCPVVVVCLQAGVLC